MRVLLNLLFPYFPEHSEDTGLFYIKKCVGTCSASLR